MAIAHKLARNGVIMFASIQAMFASFFASPETPESLVNHFLDAQEEEQQRMIGSLRNPEAL